jgi:hypothetical protein
MISRFEQQRRALMLFRGLLAVGVFVFMGRIGDAGLGVFMGIMLYVFLGWLCPRQPLSPEQETPKHEA